MPETNPSRSRKSRVYTAEERARLRIVFGEAVDYDRVSIMNGAGLNPIAAVAFANRTPAITLGLTIYLRPDFYRDDFSADMVLLAHETTHIWQYLNTLPGGLIGPPLIASQSLLKGGTQRAYDISDVRAGTAFNRLGFEQQAVVVESYYQALQTGATEHQALYGRVLQSTKPNLLEQALRSEQAV